MRQPVQRRSWSLHILPKSFTRTRCYGGYSSRYRKNFIALCHQLRPQTNADELQTTSPETEGKQEAETHRDVECILDQRAPSCPHCQQLMDPIRDTARPSWHDLFYGRDHPAWIET